MTMQDNAARRLYDLLLSYHQHADDRTSVGQAWARAAGIPVEEVPRFLTRSARLLADVDEALNRVGGDAVDALVDHHEAGWSAPIMNPNNALSAPSLSVASKPALAVLALIAQLVDSQAESTRRPESEELESLEQAIAEALEALSVDDDVPADLKIVFNHRLSDMQWAVRHVHLTGGDGVRQAVERISAYLPPDGAEKGAMSKVRAVVRKAWGVTAPALRVAPGVIAITGGDAGTMLAIEP